MSGWRRRLEDDLEPVLRKRDPRPGLSEYHDLPCAIFHYQAEDELDVRAGVAMLTTRLEQQAGKRVTTISLAECLQAALDAQGVTPEALAEAEADFGVTAAVETVHEILATYEPLDGLVADHMPAEPEPTRDVVFLVRAGALFPVFRASSLLEQLEGRLQVPTVLFYPGELEGAARQRIMGVLDAEHNYRMRIF